MASNTPFLLFLLTLFSSHLIHARESQFFNKIPSNTNNNVANVKDSQVVPQKQEDALNSSEQEPDFVPEKENGGYGLYGHESGQFPPSTTTTTPKTNVPYNGQPNDVFVPQNLPENYNPRSYVTVPEGYHGTQETNIDDDNNNYYNNVNPEGYHPTQETKNNNNNYYTANPEGYHPTQETTIDDDDNAEPEGYRPTQQNDNNNGNNKYYNTANGYYPTQKQGSSATAATGNNYGYNGVRLGQNGYTAAAAAGGSLNYYNSGNMEKQGMSDTRFLENGKYFYDVNLERNNRVPFEKTRGFGDQFSNNGGYYGNNENSYDFNKYSNGYQQNEDQFQNFQDEESLP